MTIDMITEVTTDVNVVVLTSVSVEIEVTVVVKVKRSAETYVVVAEAVEGLEALEARTGAA